MRGRVAAQTRRESSSKVDMLILVVMVALFLLTMTITFSPANFPSREYHDSIPINNHLDFITERDRAVQGEAEKRAKHEADEQARQEAVRKAEQEAEARRRHEDEERQKEVEARRLQEAEAAERRRQEEEDDARRRQEEEKQKQEAQQQQQQQQQSASQESPEDVFRQNLAKEMEADKQNWDERRKIMAVNPKTLGDEWADDTEAACSLEDCPWKAPYLDGTAFQQEKAGCDPRSRQCTCLQDWGAKDKCPESFPEDKRVTIAVTGWLLDFMGRYVEGDYDCPHSAPRVVNFESMDKSKENPDIYLSSDVPFIEKRWGEMREYKQQMNKANSKMALLYIEAEPHVSHWFGTLPELDISLTFYDWADIHLTHIQDHPSWFRNAPYPFHMKRNITFINTGCYGHRTAIVEEVMKYLPVENLGACLKNADYCELFPYCCRTPFHGSYTSRYVEKECLIHHYKFVLALENTVSFNYTTEKFFQPMKMGTVPIYWGSNSSKPLMPGDHAVIRVDDFPSIKDLAAYMKELLEDENKYNKHLEWRYKPFRKSFLEEAKDGLSTFVCRLADAYKLGQTFHGSTRMPGYGVKKF